LAFSFNCYILFYFCIFILFLFFLRERKKCEFGNNSKMGYDSCPPLYNAYEAKILRSKFCKEEKKKKENDHIILGNLPLLKKNGLFSRATSPHTHTYPGLFS
jgi:hypothetical protein